MAMARIKPTRGKLSSSMKLPVLFIVALSADAYPTHARTTPSDTLLNRDTEARDALVSAHIDFDRKFAGSRLPPARASPESRVLVKEGARARGTGVGSPKRGHEEVAEPIKAPTRAIPPSAAKETPSEDTPETPAKETSEEKPEPSKEKQEPPAKEKKASSEEDSEEDPDDSAANALHPSLFTALSLALLLYL